MNHKDYKTKQNQQKQADLTILNRRIKNCDRCRLAGTREHVLIGEGNIDARLMLIALSPGKNENIADKMFIGPSGQVLDRLLQKAGVDRQSLYMTNLIKCMLPKNRRPKRDEIDICSQYLETEIEIISAKVLVPLGYYVTRWILNQFQIERPATRQDFVQIYGHLIFQNNQKIFPLPHPATLLYNPDFESETEKKYKKLAILSQDCKWFSACPMKRFYESGLLDRKWIELYCTGDWQSCVRYDLEEKGHDHPDWMLPDGRLDENLKEC